MREDGRSAAAVSPGACIAFNFEVTELLHVVAALAIIIFSPLFIFVRPIEAPMYISRLYFTLYFFMAMLHIAVGIDIEMAHFDAACRCRMQ